MIVCLIIAGIGLLGLIVTIIVDACFRNKYDFGDISLNQYRREYEDKFACIKIMFLGIVMLIGTIILSIFGAVRYEIYDYKKTKAYIETTSNLDEETIKRAKEEYNKWLYDAQFSYTYNKLTSIYTSEIMELEEIK